MILEANTNDGEARVEITPRVDYAGPNIGNNRMPVIEVTIWGAKGKQQITFSADAFESLIACGPSMIEQTRKAATGR